MSGSLTKALTILKCFSIERPSLRIKEISKETHLNPSTIHRSLKTMQSLDFIKQKKDGSYALGRAFIGLTAVALSSMDIRKLALPFIEELANEVGSITNLAILDRSEVLYIDRIDNSPKSWVYFHIGMRRPAHCTALGKVLISDLPEVKIKEIYHHGTRNYKSNKQISIVRFLKQIKEVKTLGYATDYEEWSMGTNCIAAPIFNSNNQVTAAISISGHKSYFSTKKANECINNLTRTARIISAQLGWLTHNGGM